MSSKKLKDLLALSLSRYSHFAIAKFSLNSINIGFPVGISKLEICLLSKLNKFLHRALIEFPCADIKTLFFLNFLSRVLQKNL